LRFELSFCMSDYLSRDGTQARKHTLTSI
jgi:hypothetical protein